MIVLHGNARGYNDPLQQVEVRKEIYKHKPTIFGLTGIRTKQQKCYEYR